MHPSWPDGTGRGNPRQPQPGHPARLTPRIPDPGRREDQPPSASPASWPSGALPEPCPVPNPAPVEGVALTGSPGVHLAGAAPCPPAHRQQLRQLWGNLGTGRRAGRHALGQPGAPGGPRAETDQTGWAGGKGRRGKGVPTRWGRAEWGRGCQQPGRCGRVGLGPRWCPALGSRAPHWAALPAQRQGTERMSRVGLQGGHGVP